MTHCSVFIATSLDGFIARSDGGIDWLEAASAGAPEGEDFGYHEYFDPIDVMVMGRKTFEQVLTFPEWPYRDKPIIVLSSQLVQVPEELAERVTISHETPAELVRGLAARGLERCYVDGGKTIQSFLAAGLIDEMTITLIPILLGNGIPLFGRLDGELALDLVSSRSYPGGLVQNRYRVRSK